MQYNYPIITTLTNRLEVLYKHYDWIVLGLLAFIILIPKYQLIAVEGTYINIRIEDFVILVVYGLWVIGWLSGRFPINRVYNYRPIIFLLVYGMAITLLGIFVFQSVENANLGILHWLRRVEYVGIFFITATVAQKSNLAKYLYGLIIIGLLTWIYGFLQWQDVGFAQGVHTLSKSGELGTFSQLGYVISTFAAHYDFGTFLMLMIMLCIWGYFSHRTWWKRAVFVILALAFWWMSRLVYGRAAYLGMLVGTVTILMIKLSGWAILPMWEVFMTFDRYFKGRFSRYAYDFQFKFLPEAPPAPTPVPQVVGLDSQIDFDSIAGSIPKPGDLLSGAVNSAQGVSDKGIPQPGFIRTLLDNFVGVWSPKLRGLFSRFDINLDPSANIRLEQWELELSRLGYNFLWGNGYASMPGVGLDNDYIRQLVEIGVLGLTVFMLIIFDFAKVAWRKYRTLALPHFRYFHLAMLGFIIGLAVEAMFIDIFEASKIAFTFWYLMGLVAIFMRENDIPGVQVEKRTGT